MSEIRATLARRRRSLFGGLALATVTAMALAAVALLLLGGHTHAVIRPAARPRPSTAAVAAAFGYPQRCLRITISAADPDYASAHVDRTGACASYRGYINASFHRVDGVWRLLLDEGQLFVPNSLLAPAQDGSARAHAVSGYPLGCLSVEITLHDPRFIRAGFDHTLPCVRRLVTRGH
jgi:hypothetical protein